MPNQIFLHFIFYISALTHCISPILSQAEEICPLRRYFEIQVMYGLFVGRKE
jgi:hypothetical protein